MNRKAFFKSNFALIPLVFSGLLCIALLFLLYQKTALTNEFSEILTQQVSLFMAISGSISLVVLFYMVFHVFAVQRKKLTGNNQLRPLVEKMNIIRQIIEIIIDSKLWQPGLKEYIDDEFEGLTFFDVKEFYKGKSKLAIEFLQEKRDFNETEMLYLELKSLLFTEVKQKKLPKGISYPEQYNLDILQKWLEHKAGSGLWYYFGYKFGEYKDALDIEAIYERHQDKIITLANSINAEHFEDSSFNEVFLSRLGEYISKDLVPKLFQIQNSIGSALPRMMRFLYMLFASLIGIGVLLPLLFILFQLPIIVLICSYSFVISALFFMVVTTLPFLSRTTNK